MIANLSDLQNRVREGAAGVNLPREILETALEQGDYFLLMEWLVPRRTQFPDSVLRPLVDAVEGLLQRKAYGFPPPGRKGGVEPVVFGTGGHRGEIGVGLTLVHVYAIVTALIHTIERMGDPQRTLHFGAADLSQVKRRGFVLGHDNRLFNPEFSFYTAHLLREAGYTVRYAGRVTSPELSLAVPHLEWAGALNFTPSHNPFRYGGLKFNPADGGLAGAELTDPLADDANRILDTLAIGTWPAPEDLERLIETEAGRIERVDIHEVYLDRLNAHPVIRLGKLAAELQALPPGRRLLYVADPVWGAAVPVYESLRKRLGDDVLQVIHTEVDPYFGGQTTEPNEQTLEDALGVLRSNPAAFKVAIRNDPDSDRGLVGDAQGAIKMNKFAALVMRYLMDLGQQGNLVTTLPTSHFGPDFARAHSSHVVITPTGFKNFRPYLQDGEALVAYEESDGITIRGHILDKDGVLAGLLAVRMVLHYGRALSDLLAELEQEIGTYHWRQETFMIDMSAAEAREKLQRLGRIQPGEVLRVGEADRTVREVDTGDGFKFLLDDGSWVMMRPSGTEPKVRIYAESQESPAVTEALCERGKAMALEAVHGS